MAGVGEGSSPLPSLVARSTGLLVATGTRHIASSGLSVARGRSGVPRRALCSGAVCVDKRTVHRVCLRLRVSSHR